MFGLKDTIIVDNDFNALEDENNIINNDTETSWGWAVPS